MRSPAAIGSRRIARALLAFGCLTGLGIYFATPLASPEQLMLASDVYQHAASQLLQGDPIYHSAPTGRPGYHYLYPPIVTVVFLPHALLPSPTAAYVLQTGINLAAATGTAWLVARLLERRGVTITRFDRGLLLGFFVLSSYSAIQFINGQVNLWIAFLFALGFDAIDRRRHTIAGLAFGIAALIKVFPAVMGLWLVRLRARRAVGVALATGITGLAMGAIVLHPELTVTYVVEVLVGRFEGGTYEGQPAAAASVDGVHRQLAAIWPEGGRWHTPAGLVVVGGLLAGSLRRVETPRQRDVAGLATITAILLFLPLQPLYFPLLAVPLILLLYTLPTGATGWLFALGAGISMIHIDQESLAVLSAVMPLPTGLQTSLLELTAVVFRVMLPPTLGMWLMLIGCVAVQWRAGPPSRPAAGNDDPAGATDSPADRTPP